MEKIKKACDISPKIREEVRKRDNDRCIVCGGIGQQIAHFISRGRLGLGIPHNLAVMCVKCHFEYDNGRLHRQIEKVFREHLKAHYPEWNEKELTYSKWR